MTARAQRNETQADEIQANEVAFDDALRAVADVEGWMTDAQARRLWDRAGEVAPGGRIVEIGSFRGRSAIVLARRAVDGVEVVAIDPHGGTDRGPQEIVTTADTGEADHEAFVENLRTAGVLDRVRHIRSPSQDAGREVADPISLLYIDGAHRYAPARDDIRNWGARVAPGGTLLIHDSFSSIGVTGAVATQLLGGGRGFRYVARSGSLAEYRRDEPHGRARAGSAARQLAQTPYFLRNLTIKVLITLKLRPLTRLLGDRTGEWPY